MIIIDPIKNIVDPNTDELRAQINYSFAESLKKYIEIKGDTCRLTRLSYDAPVVELKSLKNNYNPLVTITVDCYADLDSSIKGYDVICDSYSSLVGTIVYEMYMQKLTPIRSQGYTESGSLLYGKYTDITIYLGYVTNSDDLEWMQDSTKLDTVAKRIIEGAYGPPVKQVENTDPAGNDDPYFYRIDTWKEFDTEEGDSSGQISETTYTGLPLRYLTIDSKATGFYPLPEEPETNSDDTEEPEPIPRHYTWSTGLTYTSPETVLFIGSIKSGGTPVTAYIKVGDTEYTESISDSNYKVVIFEATVNSDSNIYIGVQGTGRLDYSGIWVSPKGSLGTLDDPRSLYSIFPPGYRSVNTVTSAYNNADSIHIAVTSARSLLERAQDKRTKEESSTQQSSSDSSTGLEFVFTAIGYANALSGLMKMLGNIDPKLANIVDPTLINIDYKALEESMTAIHDLTKKTSILAAVNDIKTIESSITHLVKSEDELTEKATAIANKTQQKLEDKGTALSANTTDKLKDKIGTFPNSAKQQTTDLIDRVNSKR